MPQNRVNFRKTETEFIMFDLNTLQNITLNDKDLLEPFLRNLNEVSCEMSFTNLAMWHEAYGTQYAFDTAGRLILYSPVEKMIYFPRGATISPAELAELSTLFSRSGMTENFIYDIPSEYTVSNPDFEKYFTIDENEDNFDYLYDNKRLSNCEGCRLRKKRTLIKQFLNANPDCKIITLSETTAERFLNLALKLNSMLDQCDFLTDENKVISFACKHLQELSLNGILLTDNNGNDVGFSIWSLLNKNVADIHFEKADHSVKGAAQFLTQQAAQILDSQNVTYMNREQDLGDPGIRRAKHSLDPAMLYKRVGASVR